MLYLHYRVSFLFLFRISISFDLSKEDINVVDNLIVLSLLDYQIQLKSKDILESFNCLYVLFNRTNFKLNLILDRCNVTLLRTYLERLIS